MKMQLTKTKPTRNRMYKWSQNYWRSWNCNSSPATYTKTFIPCHFRLANTRKSLRTQKCHLYYSSKYKQMRYFSTRLCSHGTFEEMEKGRYCGREKSTTALLKNRCKITEQVNKLNLALSAMENISQSGWTQPSTSV